MWTNSSGARWVSKSRLKRSASRASTVRPSPASCSRGRRLIGLRHFATKRLRHFLTRSSPDCSPPLKDTAQSPVWMRFAVVAHSSSPTNLALAAGGWNGIPGELLTPREALLALGRGDVALARLDVRQSLDGVEDGLWALERLEEAGIRVLNRPEAVVLAHDKLLTARVLRRAGLPHPRTTLIERNAPLPDLDFPAVVKPRFGSWGQDVRLCRDREELRATLEGLTSRLWFRATGAVAQELIPPLGHDLRLVVAGGRIVAAAKRIAAP